MEDVVTKFDNYGFDVEVKEENESLPQHIYVSGNLSDFRRVTHISALMDEFGLEVLSTPDEKHYDRSEDGYVRLVRKNQE